MECSTLLTAATLSVLPGGLGAHLLRRLREAGSPATLDGYDVAAGLAAGMSPEAARAEAARATARARHALSRAADAGITAIPWGHPAYPTRLVHIPDAPPLLWVRGDAGALEAPAVAVVGSRAASPPSLEVAHQLSRDLAAAGIVIVSGLARGIDGEAHRGALEVGRTIAVLGTGTDRVYPAEHAFLTDAVAARGALVSELPPGAPPRGHHFPRRNRLISGLSLGVVVVEASMRSGSLGTARLALDQGREVMAVPGCVLGERHRGCHALLRDGAALVERAADVLDVLGLAPAPRHDSPEGLCHDSSERLCHTGDGGSGLDGQGGTGLQPCHADPLLVVMAQGHAYDLQDLVTMSSRPPADVLARLLALELTGAVTRIPGGRFFRPVRAVVR